MAKNIKDVDEISTTDKLKAFKTLKDSGLMVEFNGSGVPTVVCARVEDIDKEIKHVRKILGELRYNGSFGVRGPRKTDAIMTEGEQIITDDSVIEESAELGTESAEILTA